MYPVKADYSGRQKNFSKGFTNTKQYIIVHHTGTPEGTLNGNIKALLGEAPGNVSAHFIVDTNGDVYKLGSPDQVLWHAGQSLWGNIVGLNYHSIGIEIIGPTNGDFTNEQRGAVKSLIGHIMYVFKIPPENVLRHADLTWKGSGKKILWDGVSPSRKVDVDKSLFKNFKDWDDYRRKIEVKEAK